MLVAALDDVALDADHPLHEVPALGVEAVLAITFATGLVVRRSRSRQPAARVLEHHDVTALRGAAEPVGQLLDQDPSFLDQARLHRLRGDVDAWTKTP